MGRRPAGNKWGGGKFAPKRKVCQFCANRSKSVDYKDTALLNRFISDRGKIEPRRRTGTCNRHQHAVALAIKQARHVALLPFVPSHVHLQGIVPPLNINPVTPVDSSAVNVKPEKAVQVATVENVVAEVNSEEEEEVVVVAAVASTESDVAEVKHGDMAPAVTEVEPTTVAEK